MNDELELPDGSYSVSAVQNYIKQNYIEELRNNLPINAYINRIINRLVFKIKDGCKF